MGIAKKLFRTLQDEDWPTPPGATQEQVDAIKAPFRDLFGIDLPGQYDEFLRLADGASFNGVLIYATHDHTFDDDEYSGVLQANQPLIHGENTIDTTLRFIGEIDDQLMAYDRSDARWKVVDRIDWTVDDEEDVHPSFDALLKFLRSDYAE